MKFLLFLLVLFIIASCAYACNNASCNKACISTGSWGGACLNYLCKCFHNPGK